MISRNQQNDLHQAGSNSLVVAANNNMNKNFEAEENNRTLEHPESPDSSGSIICLDDSLPDEEQPVATSTTTAANKQKESNFFRLGPPPTDSGGEDQKSIAAKETESTNARSTPTNGAKKVEKAKFESNNQKFAFSQNTTPIVAVPATNENRFPSFCGSAFPPPSTTACNNNHKESFMTLFSTPFTNAVTRFNNVLANGTTTQRICSVPSQSMFGEIINNNNANVSKTALLTNTNSSSIFRPLINEVANKQVAEKLASFLHGIQKKNFSMNPI